jgi:geranylgeranyl transferase type-2 subunit beta
LSPVVCEPAAVYLQRRRNDPASVIDLFSYLVSCLLVSLGGGPDPLADAPPDWRDRVAATLETFRTPDGGYAKAAGAASGSTYHTFLVLLALELLDRPVPDRERVVSFVRSRRRDDGGYVEFAPMRRSGTNPTAAGVGVLEMTGALDDEARAAAVGFLVQLPSPFEGGLRSNDRIPAADLLSTFTGCWTLHQLGALDRLDLDAVRAYVAGQEVPGGGFRGGAWDAGHDVEYTFYGLGTLALLGGA